LKDIFEFEKLNVLLYQRTKEIEYFITPIFMGDYKCEPLPSYTNTCEPSPPPYSDQVYIVSVIYFDKILAIYHKKMCGAFSTIDAISDFLLSNKIVKEGSELTSKNIAKEINTRGYGKFSAHTRLQTSIQIQITQCTIDSPIPRSFYGWNPEKAQFYNL